MTYVELPDCDSADLALEIWYDHDDLSLDQAAQIAFDVQYSLSEYGSSYDLDALEWQIAVAWAVQS